MADPIRDFEIDDDGEWVTSNGDFVKVGGVDAVPQGVRIRLGMILGECYLDESVGVDYLGSINIKNPDPLVVRELLRQAIAATPDVTNVVGAQLIQEAGREAAVDFAYDSIYSEQTISDQVDVP
jgi:hypothetical protein